jgi:hypothetical protein
VAVAKRFYDGYMIMILNFACNSVGETGWGSSVGGAQVGVRGGYGVGREGGAGCTVRL